jgi:hypothetical protein
VYGVMCMAQLLALFTVIPAALPSEAAPVLRIAPSLHGGLLPRLSGTVFDSNRSGLLLVLYAAILLWHDRRRHVGMLAWLLLFLVLTLSRSAALAACAALAWHRLAIRRVSSRDPSSGTSTRALPVVGLVGASVMIAASSTLLLSPALRADTLRVLRPVAERFTVSRGSGEDHLHLLARGMETATQSMPNALQGIGYGSGYLVLQDFFPGDKYGNFH